MRKAIFLWLVLASGFDAIASSNCDKCISDYRSCLISTVYNKAGEGTTEVYAASTKSSGGSSKDVRGTAQEKFHATSKPSEPNFSAIKNEHPTKVGDEKVQIAIQNDESEIAALQKTCKEKLEKCSKRNKCRAKDP